MLVGRASNEISINKIMNIKAKISGNKTVQQNDISWSKRILGKLARTHTKQNTIKQVFKPNDTPNKTPSKIG
jgi:hypothetical protein